MLSKTNQPASQPEYPPGFTRYPAEQSLPSLVESLRWSVPLSAAGVSRGEDFLYLTGVSATVLENRYGREHQQAQPVVGGGFGVEQSVFVDPSVCVCARKRGC